MRRFTRKCTLVVSRELGLDVREPRGSKRGMPGRFRRGHHVLTRRENRVAATCFHHALRGLRSPWRGHVVCCRRAEPERQALVVTVQNLGIRRVDEEEAISGCGRNSTNGCRGFPL